MTVPFLTPLTPDQQRSLGLPDPWPLATADRVRFGELDRLAHVNNAVYMGWLETIRIRYFQDWDISQYRPDDPKIVIRQAQIDYLAEIVMDEVYVTTARCTRFRNTSFTIAHEIWAGGTLRTTMSCVIVLLTPDGSARFALPEGLRTRFREVDGAVPEA
ncbi:MAG: thioesterase family protein [Paracoccaceae bacterium]|nr:thioesterase family protein [Paracoccaceae bacterium]